MFHIIIVCRGGCVGGNSGSGRSDRHNEEEKGTDKARHDYSDDREKGVAQKCRGCPVSLMLSLRSCHWNREDHTI